MVCHMGTPGQDVRTCELSIQPTSSLLSEGYSKHLHVEVLTVFKVLASIALVFTNAFIVLFIKFDKSSFYHS